MLDRPAADALPGLEEIRARFAATSPGQADIFEAGERIAAIAAGQTPASTPRQRIAVLGSLTTDFLSRAVAVAAVLEGVLPEIYQAPYGSYVQEVLDPSSGLHKFYPELVLLAPDWRDVVDDLPVGADANAAAQATDGKVDLFRHLWECLDKLGCRVIQHTLTPAAARLGWHGRAAGSGLAAQPGARHQ